MNIQRIQAIIKRHFLLTFRSFDRVINLFYWPIINIVVWGLTSVWFQKQSNNPNLVAMVLTGLVFWQIVFRVNIETAKSLLEELYNRNLVNLFSTPLTLVEWSIAIMVLGVINLILVLVSSMAAVWFLYKLNILKMGFAIFPFIFSLLLSGWFIGFFICALLIYWGLKAQDFVFTIGWVFAPFSAVYYPLAALPVSVQKISKCLPTTYVFEAMRKFLETGILDTNMLEISYILNFIYLVLSIMVFYLMFRASLHRGLARLE